MENTTVGSNVPNLDGMGVEDIRQWTLCHRRMNKTLAQTIFPSRPPGYIRAAKNLLAYGWNKYTAMQCRLRGDVNTALVYEGICDRIYQKLPEWARW